MPRGETATEDEDKVTVRLRHGLWEIEVTSSKEDLADTIEKVVSGIRDALPPERNVPPGHKTLREALASFAQEGWFSVPRRLAEVVSEASIRGYPYGQSEVSHALLDLVKERIHERQGTDKKYTYVKSDRGK